MTARRPRLAHVRVKARPFRKKEPDDYILGGAGGVVKPIGKW